MPKLETPGKDAEPTYEQYADDGLELQLLAEFTRSPTVVLLAGAIARRLGRGARADDLIVEAGLAPEARLRRS